MSRGTGDDALDIELGRHALVPLVDESGKPRQFSPFGAHPDACSVCPARCCRWTVRASVADVVRFCSLLNVPYWAGFELSRSYDPTSFALDEPPSNWEGDDLGPGSMRADWVLRRMPDGRCAHLIELNGQLRCGVYSARPSSCRLYPVSWSSRERTGGPSMVFCPVPFSVNPDLEDRLRQEIAWSIRGRAIHAAVTREWEEAEIEGPRTPKRLAEFVLTRAAERLGEPAEPIFDGRTATERMHDAVTRFFPRGAPWGSSGGDGA